MAMILPCTPVCRFKTASNGRATCGFGIRIGENGEFAEMMSATHACALADAPRCVLANAAP